MIDPVIYLKLFLQIAGYLILGGILTAIIILLRKKYEPKIEFVALNFFSKIFKKEIKGPLLIDTQIVAELVYNQYSRELMLETNSTKKLIITPKYDSEPEKLIRYLTKNPNRNIQFNELVEKVSLSPKSNLPKLVSDLKFKGDLRKLFFQVSKTSISFTNPITPLQLRQSKILLGKLLD